jgi:DNA-nicking Smr family endonuclease
MGRRQRGKRPNGDAHDSEPPYKPGAAEAATTSLAALIKAAGLHQAPKKPPMRPRPIPARVETKPEVVPGRGRDVSPARPSAEQPQGAAPERGDIPATELRVLNDAYAGARPLPRKSPRQIVSRPLVQRVSAEDRAAEVAARKRLAELVSGGVHFRVKREDEYVEGLRADASSKLLSRLNGKGFSPEARLDLHGERAARVGDLVASFVRSHHRRGARHVLIIVGKGLHSEDGVGVLRHAVSDALTDGLAAPLVRAFASAHVNQGGTGAIAVLLI